MDYKLTPQAEDDFAEILLGVQNYSGLARSLEIEHMLYEVFRSLARNPGIGHLREDLVPHMIYFWYERPYMVLYRRDTDPLYVVSILHGSRDIAAIMEDRLSGGFDFPDH